MRTYTVFYVDDNGGQQQYKIQATDRIQAKYLAMCNLDINLSQIKEVL
jgi:hypothetical protein